MTTKRRKATVPREEVARIRQGVADHFARMDHRARASVIRVRALRALGCDP